MHFARAFGVRLRVAFLLRRGVEKMRVGGCFCSAWGGFARVRCGGE
jgi:hypothetical protein